MRLIYIDESGDHAEVATNPEYPVFVVVACIFDPESYTRRFVPALLEFKIRYWAHEAVVLHEREIRKSSGDFAFLYDQANRHDFLKQLSRLVMDSEVEIAAVVWDKRRSSRGRSYADCLVRLLALIEAMDGEGSEPLVAVIESRGRKEDLEIRHAVDVAGMRQPWRLVFAPKSRNVAGLQLADLCARPIGLKVLAPERQNRAFDETIYYLLSAKAGDEPGKPLVLD